MPTSLLDKIRAALKRPTSTVQQLADALADARKAEADATVAVERLAAKVQAGFLDDDATRGRDREALAAARVAAEDAAALLAEASRRHAAALDAEEQERRLGLYTSARARADEAAAELAKAYPVVVKGALNMLAALAKAQRDVEVANSQLPAGMPALDDPEVTVRGIPYRPQEIVAETEVVLWTRHDMPTPVNEPYQSEIVEARDGWGIHPGSADRTADDEPSYLRVRYLRREVRQPVYGVSPSPLAAALRLPALRGAGMAWGAPEIEHAVNPTLMAVMAGQARPDSVLGRMAELDAAPPAKPKADEPEIRVEWEMLGYVGPSPLKPAPYQTYSRGGPENPNPQPDANPKPIGTDLIGLPGLQWPHYDPPSPRLVQSDGSPTRAGALR